MTDDAFKALCNTYGFAPSRALRELIDCVRAQEIAACANVVERYCGAWSDEGFALAAAIRARSNT